ncbi:MAG: J domain-containing protein [Actinomycetota bacterium]|nr:J domain-containing protein [Actinomycetota bacterium]
MAQRDWAEKDYYKVLGVDKTASKDEIKRAYRKLAQKNHPDANKGDAAAEARFKDISEAYSILSNDQKRAEYDQMRKLIEAGGDRFYGFTPGGGENVRVNIGDLFGNGTGASVFDDLLGGFGFRPRGPQRGDDLESEVTLTFDQAISGATVTLETGARVRIPAGVKNGARIRVPGKGRSMPGGQPGDLYVRVNVQPHPIFSSAGNGDIALTVPVTFVEAALGAKIEVPTLDGSVTVKVPAGTSSGKTLRVRGRGAPRPSGGNGDLLVKIGVEVPRKLSRREKEALERFAELHKASPRKYLAEYVQDATKAAS